MTSTMLKHGLLVPDRYATGLDAATTNALKEHAHALGNLLSEFDKTADATRADETLSERGRAAKIATVAKATTDKVAKLTVAAIAPWEAEVVALRKEIPARVAPPRLDSEFDGTETILSGPESRLARELRRNRVDARLREIRTGLQRMDKAKREAFIYAEAARADASAQWTLAALADAPIAIVPPETMTQLVGTFWSVRKPDVAEKIGDVERAVAWAQTNAQAAARAAMGGGAPRATSGGVANVTAARFAG